MDILGIIVGRAAEGVGGETVTDTGTEKSEGELEVEVE